MEPEYTPAVPLVYSFFFSCGSAENSEEESGEIAGSEEESGVGEGWWEENLGRRRRPERKTEAPKAH